MTSNNLLKFLGNREYLHQVSYQELKSLVMQYPYSLSLRYLLAMKSQQEDNTDLDRNIELLATYGIDRTHLHKLFREEPIVLEDLEESVVMGEDFLELKELSTLERSLEVTALPSNTNNITFMEEGMELSSNDKQTTASLKEFSPVEAEIPALKELDALEANLSTPTVEAIETDDLAITKEEFVELDFEDDSSTGEATGSNDVVSSESISDSQPEFDQNGLPTDAVEVNDLFVHEQEEHSDEAYTEEPTLEEEAVSDSFAYMDRPEEVLDAESKDALSNVSTEIIIHETEQADIIEDQETYPSIPLEVTYTDTNPILDASPITETEDIAAEIAEETLSTATDESNKKTEVANEVEHAQSLAENLSPSAEPTAAAPLPKSSFHSWQEQDSSVHSFSGIDLLVLNDGGKKIKKTKRIIRKKFEKTVAFAEESLKSDTHIASETLAHLLVKQGHYVEAKAMYEELCLTIPEKSAYFAAEIEKIATLMNEGS